ncbi:hypothetical protein BDR22DRAFT_886189 [Usnea florida]
MPATNKPKTADGFMEAPKEKSAHANWGHQQRFNAGISSSNTFDMLGQPRKYNRYSGYPSTDDHEESEACSNPAEYQGTNPGASNVSATNSCARDRQPMGATGVLRQQLARQHGSILHKHACWAHREKVSVRVGNLDSARTRQRWSATADTLTWKVQRKSPMKETRVFITEVKTSESDRPDNTARADIHQRLLERSDEDVGKAEGLISKEEQDEMLRQEIIDDWSDE